MTLTKRVRSTSSPKPRPLTVANAIAVHPATTKKHFRVRSIKPPVTHRPSEGSVSHAMPESDRLQAVPQSTEGLSEPAWGMLLDRIDAKMCTVFIGAGANDGILPDGAQIAEDWAQTFKFPLRDHELPKVAQFVAVEANTRHFLHRDLVKRLRRQTDGIDLDKKIASSPLALLAQLPVRCYMTTNYDGFMYRALELAGKKPQLDICKWYKDDEEEVRFHDEEMSSARPKAEEEFNPTVERPVVFHLHGHESNPKSMVLTEDDYYDFLISWGREKGMIPPLLETALVKTSLLFIGYRLADMSFRVLFRSLFRAMGIDPEERVANVAVQVPPRDAPESTKRYLSKYFREAKIEVFWGKACAFVEEFRPRLQRAGIIP